MAQESSWEGEKKDYESQRGWITSRKTFSRYDRAFTNMNSQFLQQQDLCKLKPDKIPARRGEGGYEILPLVVGLLVD